MEYNSMSKMEKSCIQKSQRTWTWYLVSRVFIVDILGLVTGIVGGWSSPVLAKLSNDADNPLGYTITVEETSWIGSLSSLGAVFGPFLAGYCAERIGRKKTLIGIALCFTICIIILVFASDINWYYISRFITGIAYGGHYTVVPIYLVELAGDTNRCIVGTSAIVFASIGHFMAVAIGPFVSIMIFNLISLIFPIIFTILFIVFNPETPQYLLKIGKVDEAKLVYDKFRQSGAILEFEEMKVSNDNDGKKRCWRDIFRKKYRKTVIITTTLFCFKPLLGANAISVYMQNIFESIGKDIPADVLPIIISGVVVLAHFITPFYIEKVGRKTLLLLSSLGICIASIILGFYYYYKNELGNFHWIAIICLFCISLFYGFGFGTVAWTVMSELLPTNIKSSVSAVANGFCWLGNFLVTLALPLVSDKFGESISFWIFAAFNILALIFTWLYIPETKGKSAKDAQELLS